jgi:tetratricopeptide (TPR) repeat protein
MSDLKEARNLLSNGAYAEALNIVSALIQSGGPKTELIEIQSYINQKIGNFELAMEGWNSLIAHVPNEAAYYLERGVCKFNLNFKSAIEDFNQAILLEPQNAYYHSAIAYILDKQGKLSEAVEHYHIAIELEPDNEITINNLAVTEQKRGHISEAENLFKATDDLLIKKGLMPERPKPQTIKKEEAEIEKMQSTTKTELLKMLSSWAGFKQFLKEAKLLFKG